MSTQNEKKLPEGYVTPSYKNGQPSYKKYTDENGNPVDLEPTFNGKYWAHPGMVPFIKFEEYAPKFANTYFLKFEDSILEARWHTEGKSAIWAQPLHRAIWQLNKYVGQDRDVECFIFGGSGEEFIHGQDPNRLSDDKHLWWMTYEDMYYDGCNDCESIIFDVQVPTIGVINGDGWHYENCVFADITLMAEEGVCIDPHYFVNMVPGDGIQLAMQGAMGVKKANYAMLMAEKISAEKAVEYGLVNEIMPREKLYDRAWEIAHILLKGSSHTRRASVMVLRKPWRKLLASDLRDAFGTEMWTTLTGHAKHSNEGWEALIEHEVTDE